MPTSLTVCMGHKRRCTYSTGTAGEENVLSSSIW